MQVEPRNARRQSQKFLIVTGDDFGLNTKANEAIEQLHQAGLLTQTSLMVNEAGVDEALRIARRNPGLRVGLHLTLCLGKGSPCSSGTRLVDAAGQLSRTPAGAGIAYALRRGLRAALAGEIEAQFERFLALGFPPLYWDGHTHLHLHPLIMKWTVPVAQAAGFRAVRLVREAGWGLLPGVFRLLSQVALPQLHAAGIAVVGRIYGLQKTGQITTAQFTRYIEAIATTEHNGNAWSEIYLHPGAEPEPLDAAVLLRTLGEKEIVLGHAGELHLGGAE